MNPAVMEVYGARQLAAALRAAANDPRPVVIVAHHAAGKTIYRLAPRRSANRVEEIARAAFRARQALK